MILQHVPLSLLTAGQEIIKTFSLSMYHEMYFIVDNQGLYFTSFVKELKKLT